MDYCIICGGNPAKHRQYAYRSDFGTRVDHPYMASGIERPDRFAVGVTGLGAWGIFDKTVGRFAMWGRAASHRDHSHQWLKKLLEDPTRVRLLSWTSLEGAERR